MKLFVYKSGYRLEAFDRGDFKDYTCYLQNIANIIKCFIENNSIVFSIEEDIFYDEEYEVNRLFIKDRIMFSKRFWSYNIPMDRDECPNIIWYKAEKIEEIIEVLRDNLYCFNCAIIDNDSEIEDAAYILDFDEGSDFNSLTIREKNIGGFISKVLPKVEAYLKEKIEIIELS